MKENLKTNQSEKHQNIHRRNLFQTTKKELAHKQNRCFLYR